MSIPRLSGGFEDHSLCDGTEVSPSAEEWSFQLKRSDDDDEDFQVFSDPPVIF